MIRLLKYARCSNYFINVFRHATGKQHSRNCMTCYFVCYEAQETLHIQPIYTFISSHISSEHREYFTWNIYGLIDWKHLSRRVQHVWSHV